MMFIPLSEVFNKENIQQASVKLKQVNSLSQMLSVPSKNEVIKLSAINSEIVEILKEGLDIQNTEIEEKEYPKTDAARSKMLRRLVGPEIAEKIESIKLADGQDTTIDDPVLPSNNNIPEAPVKPTPSSGPVLGSGLLDMLVGPEIAGFIRLAGGSAMSLINNIMTHGWSFLKSMVFGLIKTAKLGGAAALKLGQKAIKGAGELAGKAKSGIKNTAEKIKATKTPKLSSATVQPKVPSKMSGVMKKVAKFTRFIPGLGAAVAAGAALYSGYKGYEEADEIMGVKKPTMLHRIASAAGMIVQDASFDAVNARTVADKVVEVGAYETVNKLENQGAIDWNIWGKSEVTDWEAVKKLPKDQLGDLVAFNDWSPDTHEKLKNIHDGKMDEVVTPAANKDKKIVETQKGLDNNVQMTKKYDTQAKSVPMPTSGHSTIINTSNAQSKSRLAEVFEL